MQRDGWYSFRILLEAVCLKGSEVDFHEEVCVLGSTKLFTGPLHFPGSDAGLGCSWALEELAAAFPGLSAQQQMTQG